jgi:FkbM family methyltransferase
MDALYSRRMKVLGVRPLGFAAREAIRPANWVALGRMFFRYPQVGQSARRYFTGRGSYPYRCEVRTPQGIVAPILFSQHDMITVHEVFCREDYRTGPDTRVVLDLGSNIGISALYFLTRSPDARIWLYEPVPENVEKLKRNLDAFEGRWQLEQVAVADRSGEETFSVEPTGRYGGLAARHSESIHVSVHYIDDVLRTVLSSEPHIDVLKVDTEGTEASILRAASPELLARVRLIYAEDMNGKVGNLPGFSTSRRASVARLRRRRSSASRSP